jgi:pimeloyl-ACP methyl ester carboxylesterase
MNVYFISGLGADERVFQRLELPQHWNIIHVKWIEPKRREPLHNYVARLAEGIDQSKPFCLVGLSFGGMVAGMMSNILRPECVVILSSIHSKAGLPLTYRMLGLTGLHRLVPAGWLNKVYPFTYWYFGTKTKESKALLKVIIHDTPARFLQWAINEIMHWKEMERPPGLYHIHGSQDRIFPIERVDADLSIEGGGHFMVLDRAKEVSAAIIAQIEKPR